MELKTFEFKGTISDAGQLEGYGAVYGNVDLGGDMLGPNSCVNVDEFVKTGSLMVGHAWGTLGVGTFDLATQDEKGLFFKATYHTDQASQAARTIATERLARGKFVGLSIGYSVVADERKNIDGKDFRYISKWKAFEVSQVATPMNPLAGATGGKSFEDEYDGALMLVKSVLMRAQGIKTLRETQGRESLSALNTDRLKALTAETDGLLSSLKSLLEEPKPTGLSEAEMGEIHLAMAKQALVAAGLL